MSATWFDGVTLTIEVGFASDPATAIASTTWTDVTAYARSVDIQQGRGTELDTFQPGTARVVFNNSDRRFDPNYSAGPYFGNLYPMRRIRIRATYAGTTYSLFSGYVDAWPQAYDSGNRYAEVTVTATDGFKALSLSSLPESVYAMAIEASAPLAWYRLGERNGTVATDSSGNLRDGTYQGGAVFNSRVGLVYGSADNCIEFDAIDDRIVIPNVSGYPFSFECWFSVKLGEFGNFLDDLRTSDDYSDGSTQVTITNTGVINGKNTNTDSAQEIHSAAGWSDERVHHLIVTFPNGGSSNGSIYIDGVDATVSSGTIGVLPITFPARWDMVIGYGGSNWFNGFMDEVALYNVSLTATDASNHYVAGTTPWNGDTSGARVGRILDEIGWPAADRDVATGLSTLGPVTFGGKDALTFLREVEATEQGQLYMSADGKVVFRDRQWRYTNSAAITSNATFGDTGGALPYADIHYDYSDTLVRNRVIVERDGGTHIDISDATSTARYLERVQRLAPLQNQSDAEMRDLANFVLARYKDSHVRVAALDVKPRARPVSLFPQVLGRALGERITVKRLPQNVGSTISQDNQIEGIRHSFDYSGEWVTSWTLSPADSPAFFILDSATFGLLDSNALAF